MVNDTSDHSDHLELHPGTIQITERQIQRYLTIFRRNEKLVKVKRAKA